MKKTIALCSLLAVLMACSNLSNIGKVGTSQGSILSTQWVLADNVKGKAPVLNIQEGKVFGNAGCNDYNAQLMLNPTDGSFSVKGITTTRMMCENSAVEGNFLSMLSSANKYVMVGNTLELYKDGLLLMKLNKK